MKKYKFVIGIICLFALAGCGSKEHTTEETTTATVAPFVATELNASTESEYVPVVVTADMFTSGNDAVNEAAAGFVEINENEDIEAQEWIDDDKQCYRVKMEYTIVPEGEYQHKRDYFFYVDTDKVIPLIVDYPISIEYGQDRYVNQACDFEAQLVDVTFDGNKDIIISLGHVGSQGTLVHCAYIYDNGKLYYTNTFEQIPNYEIDNENQMILGIYTREIVMKVTSKYEYNAADHSFVLIGEEEEAIDNGLGGDGIVVID